MSWFERQILKSIGAYLTSEVKTGARWVANQPIYRKAFSVGTLPNATTSSTAHNISGTFTLLDIRGMAINGTTQLPINRAFPSATGSIAAYRSGANIVIETALNYSAYSGFVILEYIKE